MDDIKKPFFTVAIPAYNRLAYTRQAVESVLSQTFIDFELLVVDDFSTEDLLSYLGSVNDKRVRVYRNEKNLGIVFNWRKCIELAEGKWFRFLLNDDVLFKDALEITAELIDKFKDNYVIVTSGKDFTDENQLKSFYRTGKMDVADPCRYLKNMDEIIQKRKRFTQTWAMPNSYTLLTKDLKELVKSEKYKLVEDNLGKTGHCVDYFILYAVAIKYKTMIEMDLPLYGVRCHPGSFSKTYNMNLLYHLNGDKFVHYLLYSYKGFDKFIMIRHAFYIYFNKIISNKRKIFSTLIFKWTRQLIVFLFSHIFNIKPNLNLKAYG